MKVRGFWSAERCGTSGASCCLFLPFLFWIGDYLSLSVFRSVNQISIGVAGLVNSLSSIS